MPASFDFDAKTWDKAGVFDYGEENTDNPLRFALQMWFRLGLAHGQLSLQEGIALAEVDPGVWDDLRAWVSDNLETLATKPPALLAVLCVALATKRPPGHTGAVKRRDARLWVIAKALKREYPYLKKSPSVNGNGIPDILLHLPGFEMGAKEMHNILQKSP